MPYFRQNEITPTPYTGDTRKQAVLDLDADLTSAFEGMTSVSDILDSKLDKSTIGIADGVCPTDGDNRVPLANIDTLPVSVLPSTDSYPIGGIIIYPLDVTGSFPVDTPIGYWVECDGRALSKTTYPTLFDTIGYRFGGSGDSFYIPDLRGRFVRGWDHGALRDPEAASRTDSGDGTTGNHVGTLQSHSMNDHSHIWYYQDSWMGQGGVNTYFSWDNRMDGYVTSVGGSESRPANVYVTYIIRISE